MIPLSSMYSSSMISLSPTSPVGAHCDEQGELTTSAGIVRSVTPIPKCSVNFVSTFKEVKFVEHKIDCFKGYDISPVGILDTSQAGTSDCAANTYTKEKPHQCSVAGCGKRFIQPSHLKSHMRTHTREGTLT